MTQPRQQHRQTMTLPACGMWVGSGIYPMSKDYFLGVLHAHQSWMPQRFHPLEMMDKIIADNQGNLAQVWGAARGYAASTHAEWFYALDEIGIHVADTNWETMEGCNPRMFQLHCFGKRETVTLAPAEFRLLNAATGATLATDPGGERVGVDPL